jgi:predicted site-specific integrase-resolvase
MRNLPDLLTPAEVAEVLKVAVNTLATWRHRGQGPPYIAVESRVRYPRAGLCAWLEENTTTSAVG